MAGAPEKFTKEQMIEMARECKGMAYVMARRLGCVVKTVYNYRDRYDEVREAMEHEDGMVDDVAELKLFEAIKNGEAWAIRFRLKHKGKGRGYSEHSEIDVTTTGSIDHTHHWQPDEDAATEIADVLNDIGAIDSAADGAATKGAQDQE